MDFLVIIGLVLLIVSFAMPAKVKFKDDYIFFSVWPFFRRKRLIKDLESYRFEIGGFPIQLKFRDGQIYRWTSFPFSSGEILHKTMKDYGIRRCTCWPRRISPCDKVTGRCGDNYTQWNRFYHPKATFYFALILGLLWFYFVYLRG